MSSGNFTSESRFYCRPSWKLGRANSKRDLQHYGEGSYRPQRSKRGGTIQRSTQDSEILSIQNKPGLVAENNLSGSVKRSLPDGRWMIFESREPVICEADRSLWCGLDRKADRTPTMETALF